MSFARGLEGEGLLQWGENMTNISITALLRQTWENLRQITFNKTCSVLRYEITDEGKPHLGIPPTKELVANLDAVPVYCAQVDIKEVIAGHGKIELSDWAFVFYTEIKATDQILFNGVTYEVIQMRGYDPDIGIYSVIGRAVSKNA